MADRELKIKSGVLKRLSKELAFYKKEVTQLEQKLSDAAADQRRLNDLLEESRAASAAVQTRASSAFEDLQAILDSASEDIANSEEYAAAKQLIAEVGDSVSSH
ncbi:MAG: hypothetical protein MHM6MM_005516 [Cercozoa sp. M6MM]